MSLAEIGLNPIETFDVKMLLPSWHTASGNFEQHPIRYIESRPFYSTSGARIARALFAERSADGGPR